MSVEKIIEYARACANMAPGRTFEEAYLKRGKAFSREPLTRDEQDEVWRLVLTGFGYKPGECFMNAGRITTASNVPLVCGLAMGPWPVEHAWNAYKGRAIDVTWPVAWTTRHAFGRVRSRKSVMERVNFNIEKCAYFGVEIAAKDAQAHFVCARRYSSPVTDRLDGLDG